MSDFEPVFEMIDPEFGWVEGNVTIVCRIVSEIMNEASPEKRKRLQILSPEAWQVLIQDRIASRQKTESTGTVTRNQSKTGATE